MGGCFEPSVYHDRRDWSENARWLFSWTGSQTNTQMYTPQRDQRFMTRCVVLCVMLCDLSDIHLGFIPANPMPGVWNACQLWIHEGLD